MHVGLGLLTLFPGRVGGSETYVRGLLERFRRGEGPERVTVLANRPVLAAYRDLVGGPVALHHMASYRAGDRDVTRALAMAAAGVAPARAARDLPAGLDVLHLPVTVPIPRAALPTVVTVHDVQHLAEPERHGRALRAYRAWAYEGSARAADAVVAVSEFMGRVLVERGRVPQERVHVVHLGIDLERFRPEPAPDDLAVRAGLGLPERYVLYPANVWPHKNHERLLEAFARVGDDALALVLPGQGYGARGRLLALAERLGIAARVHLPGHVAPERMPALFRGARATVFPSLHEGFGAPPLEAMACGCPVAASGRGSLGEVLGDAALALDPEDAAQIAAAIERVIGDAEVRARLRAAGLGRARRFTWSAAARAHVAVYRAAAETSGSIRPSRLASTR